MYMARQYSLKTFIRRAPNELLCRYLDQHGVGNDVPWSQLKESGVEPVYRAIEEADERIRRQIDRDFREILGMADEAA